MSKAAMNLQDSFLNQVRRENAEVKVVLTNGTVLRGIVKGFDNFTVIVNNRNGQHLVYKHAIAQLVSHRGGDHRREANAETSETEKKTHKTDPEAKQESGQKSKREGFNTLDLSNVKI
jgi:host factor-I protein